jgi:predicted transcriptional regulator
MATSSFAKFVKKRLIDLDMSQAKAAMTAGFAESHFAHVLVGSNMTIKTLCRAAKALQVNPQDLLTEYLKGDDDAPGH